MNAVNLEQLPLAKIKPHPKNVRQALGDLTELTASIKAKGVLQPVVVVPAGGRGSGYWLLVGHRRSAAAKAARLKEIPAIVREDLAGEGEQLETMLVENLQRADLTALEEGDAYTQLLALDDYTVKAISERTGRAQKTVRERVTLAKSPDVVRQRVQAGQVTIDQALAIAEFDDDAELQATLIRDLGTPNFAWRLQRARDDRRAKKAAEKERRALTKAGVRLLTDDELDPGNYEDEDKAPWALGELRDLVPATVDGEQDEAELAKLTVEGHASCEGHAAIVGYPGVPEYYCTKPELHNVQVAGADDSGRGPAASTEASRAAAAEQKAAREKQEQRRRDLLTAAVVRRRHLGDVVTRGDEDLALGSLRQVVLSLFPSWGNDAHLQVLGLDPTGVAEKDREAAVEQALQKLTLPQLAILGALFRGLAYDRLLEQTHAWREDRNLPWIEALENVYGYAWSDVEHILLAERRQIEKA